MMRLRYADAGDAARLDAIFRAVVARGDSYVYEKDLPEARVRDYWLGDGVVCVVCVDDEELLGMYRLVPNQPGRGAHVANASFMVAPGAQGRGVGRELGEDCIARARALGYRAMQFNFVVSTNTAALTLWRALGFDVIGTLPGAFRHETLGYVDALVMFRTL